MSFCACCFPPLFFRSTNAALNPSCQFLSSCVRTLEKEFRGRGKGGKVFARPGSSSSARHYRHIRPNASLRPLHCAYLENGAGFTAYNRSLLQHMMEEIIVVHNNHHMFCKFLILLGEFRPIPWPDCSSPPSFHLLSGARRETSIWQKGRRELHSWK